MVMMFPVPVNYLPIVVSTVIAFIIGWLWYSPLFFGNMWMKLAKISPKGDKPKGMAKVILINLVSTFVLFYVLAHVVIYANASKLFDGMFIGFMCWLGFIATTSLGMVLWEGKSWKLYALNIGYYFVTFLIGSAILTVWH